MNLKHQHFIRQLKYILVALLFLLVNSVYSQLNLVKNSDFIINTLPTPLLSCNNFTYNCEGVVEQKCFYP
jgi:hypothetical protein